MHKSSKVNTAEQLQVGQIPSKPTLNPLFRLDYENKIKTNSSQPIEDTPSKPQSIKDVTIQSVSDAVITTTSIVPSNFRRDDSVSRSRSRSRQKKTLKFANSKKRSQECLSQKDHIKGVQRSKYRSKNDVSFSRRSSARLQEKVASKIQSPFQSDSKIDSSKSKLSVLESSNPLNGISSFQKKEDSSNNTHTDKFFKTRICPQFLNGYCDREERCTYAHGQQQIRQFQGSCFKTKICYNFTQGRCHKRSDQCKYAHGASDLRGSKDSQRNETKMQVQEKKSYSPQANYKSIKKAKVESSGNRDVYKDNYQSGRRNKGNKFTDNRKVHEQTSDKQRFQRERQRQKQKQKQKQRQRQRQKQKQKQRQKQKQKQRTQKSFLQRQKNRQRQQFSKQSTLSTFSRSEYFGGNNFAQQRQTPNVFRQQYQNVPIYGQPLMQSYPVNPQMLNYSLPDFHNYYMQMQMLHYMPQQPINFYHQYPNYENGMQPFEYRQFGQLSYPVSNVNNSRGNQAKKQQTNISIADKKIGKFVEKGPEY